METFDSYGARQEPVEDVAIAKDWQGEGEDPMKKG